MRFNTILNFLVAAGLVASAPLAPIVQVANVADIIPNNWIVVMKDISDSTFASHLANRDARVASGTKSTYNLGSFKAYSGVFDQGLVNLIASSLDVSNSYP